MCLEGDTLKKKDVLSLISNPTRLAIIRRLSAAGKAAYGDIMDSVNYIQPLNSTGNLNYHLNFLMKNRIIEKMGTVYRLTENGSNILSFVEDTEDRWRQLQRSLSGDIVNVIHYAEQFEDETGIKMEEEVIDFQGLDMLMDENRIIGIIQLGEDTKIFRAYSLLKPDGFSIVRQEYQDVTGDSKRVTLLRHSDLKYELSPKWFGVVQDFLERNFGNALVYANPEVPSPFLLRSMPFGEKEIGCSFVVAPSVLDETQRKQVPQKE